LVALNLVIVETNHTLLLQYYYQFAIIYLFIHLFIYLFISVTAIYFCYFERNIAH